MNSSTLAAELLKVRRRWMPYVLLIVMVAILALQIFGFYGAWRGDEDRQQWPGRLQTFAWPWSLPFFLDTMQFLGVILLAILAASSVGTEHGWGTVRQALIRGQSRSQYLATKLLGIAVMGGVGFLLAFGFGLWFSVLATGLAGLPITLDVPDGPSVPAVALMALRTAYAILPYVLMAFCLSVVGRSTTLGVAAPLIYVFTEAIILVVLGTGGHAADARAFLMGHNVSALLTANSIGDLPYFHIAPRGISVAPELLPDPSVAALVLALYCLAFLAIAFGVFRRRDIHA